MKLTEAIQNGKLEEVKAAMAAGENKVQGAPSPILLAVYHQEPEVAEYLREQKGQLDLFEAAALGDLHQLEQLVKDSPQVDAFSGDGFTALGYAAFFGHIEAVRLLLKAGADPNLASKNPLKVAPLHSALAEGRKEMARLLVEKGADVDAASGAGWTPLHYCANNGDLETARYLIDHGAKGDSLNEDQKLPADLSEEKGHTSLAEILRPKGA